MGANVLKPVVLAHAFESVTHVKNNYLFFVDTLCDVKI